MGDYEYFKGVDGKLNRRKKPAVAKKKAVKVVAEPSGEKKKEQRGVRGWMMRKSPKFMTLMKALD